MRRINKKHMVIFALIVILIAIFLLGYISGYVSGALEMKEILVEDAGHLLDHLNINIENIDISINETELVDYAYEKAMEQEG